MKKLKVFSNAQKEEQWLNKMLQKGWQLKNVNAFNVYSFEETSNVVVLILRMESLVQENTHASNNLLIQIPIQNFK